MDIPSLRRCYLNLRQHQRWVFYDAHTHHRPTNLSTSFQSPMRELHPSFIFFHSLSSRIPLAFIANLSYTIFLYIYLLALPMNECGCAYFYRSDTGRFIFLLSGLACHVLDNNWNNWFVVAIFPINIHTISIISSRYCVSVML